METENRYFVRIAAPNRRALLELGKMGLDLFGHTTVHAAFVQEAARPQELEAGLEIEGLLNMAQVEQLIKAGYRVTIEEEAAKRARAANVIEFEQWLKEMGER